jgi:hypothetical protein
VTVSPGDTVVGLTLLTTGTGGSCAGSSLQAISEAASAAIAKVVTVFFRISIHVIFMLFL